MADEVPAGEAQLANLPEHLLSFDRQKVFLLVAVGAGGEAHLTLDHREIGPCRAHMVLPVIVRPAGMMH
jgi:hypothetical protein